MMQKVNEPYLLAVRRSTGEIEVKKAKWDKKSLTQSEITTMEAELKLAEALNGDNTVLRNR